MTSDGQGTASLICITGMHRSGTSFVARALSLLGVSLGDERAMMPPGPDNLAGYWEIQRVKELDDEVISHLGGAWDFPPLLEPGWEHDPSLEPFRDRARAILADNFGPDPAEGAPIAIKDPRISLLMPFWRTVMPVRTSIVMVRSPHEVVRSLGVRRYAVAPQQATILWLRYLYAATANDPGHLLLRHQDLFDDLDGTIDRIVAHLGLAAPGEATRAAVGQTLDPSLRHQRGDGSVAHEPRPVEALADEVWNDGRPDLAALPSVVRTVIAQGWLRGPLDDEALVKARADVVRLKERVKQLQASATTAAP